MVSSRVPAWSLHTGERDRAMIIAMIPMRMMEPALHQIVHVIPMRDRFVAASRTMHMLGFMSAVPKGRCAIIRIFGAHLNDMLLDDITCLMMEMAVVEIVDMVAMLDCDMTAGWPMRMRMIGMNTVAVSGHLVSFPSFKIQCGSQACSMRLSTRLRTCLSAIE